jgi:hypothetical protein
MRGRIGEAKFQTYRHWQAGGRTLAMPGVIIGV